MNVKFNEVTGFSKLASIFFIFGILPAAVFHIGREYQRTVNVISYGKDTAYQLHASGTYQQKTYTGEDATEIESGFKGDWVSEQDSSYVLRLEESNSFFDIYDAEPVASGTWIIRNSLPDTRFADLEKGVYLEKDSLSTKGIKEMLYYKVIFKDGDGMALMHLERGNILSFARRVATTSIRAELRNSR